MREPHLLICFAAEAPRGDKNKSGILSYMELIMKLLRIDWQSISHHTHLVCAPNVRVIRRHPAASVLRPMTPLIEKCGCGSLCRLLMKCWIMTVACCLMYLVRFYKAQVEVFLFSWTQTSRRTICFSCCTQWSFFYCFIFCSHSVQKFKMSSKWGELV